MRNFYTFNTSSNLLKTYDSRQHVVTEFTQSTLDTLLGVSSPSSVVKSMQVTTLKSQAACHSFLIERRVLCVLARRCVAGKFTRLVSTQPRSRANPGFLSDITPVHVLQTGTNRPTLKNHVRSHAKAWRISSL